MPRKSSMSRLGVTLAALSLLTGVVTMQAYSVQAKSAAGTSVGRDARLARVEHYFNNIRTMVARFRQEASDGSGASGTFYLWRPGRMRLEYDPPLNDFLVADGWYIYHWDDELESQSQQPISDNLVQIFLREKFRLSGEVSVVNFAKRHGFFEVTVVLTENPDSGQLILVLTEEPLQLVRWRVRDAQGGVINVTLGDVRVGVDIEPWRFYFEPPEGSFADD